jgi:hypothetical protein
MTIHAAVFAAILFVGMAAFQARLAFGTRMFSVVDILARCRTDFAPLAGSRPPSSSVAGW